jgi:ubiquinone biosynthesis protein Coq4
MAATRQLKRHYWAGITSSVKHLMNPISEKGASHAYKAHFYLAGPRIGSAFEEFSNHPDGSRLLRDRPNLGDHLAQVASAEGAPEGSFAEAYRHFVGVDEFTLMDTKKLASLAHVDVLADELGWDEDVAWFVERMTHTHDLHHVLAGYGPTLANEGGVIFFSQAHSGARKGLLTTYLWSFRPRVGWRLWHRYLRDAWQRGLETAAAGELLAAYYEELLPRPLEEVRRELGIPSYSGPVGGTSAWFNMKRYRRFLSGYGAMSEDETDTILALNR